MSTKRSDALKFLDKSIGEPASFGATLQTIRLSDEMAKKIGITSAHLSQLAQGHKFVSSERALTFAKKLGYSPKMLIGLSLQDQLQRAGIKLKVRLELLNKACVIARKRIQIKMRLQTCSRRSLLSNDYSFFPAEPESSALPASRDIKRKNGICVSTYRLSSK